MNEDALEYYANGAWYDAEYIHIRYDVPYYIDVGAETAQRGRLLELACGTGRLSLPMVHAGCPLLGVDISAGMIAEANKKRERTVPGDQARMKFIVGDMRSLRLGEKFAAVVLAFNTLMHMIDDDDLAGTLDTVREHLAEDGRFYLDLHVPYPDATNRDPDGRFDPMELIDPATRKRYIVSENSHYDARTQLNTMFFYYQEVDARGSSIGPERVRRLELRVIFPRELDRWLHLHGLQVIEDWDDFDRTKPFSGVGGRRVMVAKKR